MKNRVAICLMAVLAATASAVPARAAGNGQAIAFASIAANGTLTSQGGLSATSAAIVRNGAGDYTVTFGGKFVKGTTATQLVLNSTAATAGGVFSSSSAVILNASTTQIAVEVFTWDNSLRQADSNCFVAVYQGKTPPPPPSTAVNVGDDFFSPTKLTINRGQTVHWTNKGGEQHTVTGNPGPSNCGPSSTEVFDSSTMNPGDTFDHTFNSSGTFAYHCELHGCPMKGTITVN
jgi:plastocyanin